MPRVAKCAGASLNRRDSLTVNFLNAKFAGGGNVESSPLLASLSWLPHSLQQRRVFCLQLLHLFTRVGARTVRE